jgi:hypothetical protein
VKRPCSCFASLAVLWGVMRAELDHRFTVACVCGGCLWTTWLRSNAEVEDLASALLLNIVIQLFWIQNLDC